MNEGEIVGELSEIACVFHVRPESADVFHREATLRTSPSSGQASIITLLRHYRLLACQSGAAFEGSRTSLGIGYISQRWLLSRYSVVSSRLSKRITVA